MINKEREETGIIDDKIQIWTGNKIGNEGVRMISEALKCNSTLTELNLSREEW